MRANIDTMAGARLGCLLITLLLAGCDAGNSTQAQSQPSAPFRTEPAPLDPEQRLRLRVAEVPTDVQAKIQLANLYYDQSRHREAIPIYVAALEQVPTDVNVRTDLGTCYVALEQYDQARSTYEQVIQQDPSHMKSFFNLGVVENVTGNFSRAAELWDQAGALATNPAQAEQVRDLAQQARQKASGQASGG